MCAYKGFGISRSFSLLAERQQWDSPTTWKRTPHPALREAKYSEIRSATRRGFVTYQEGPFISSHFSRWVRRATEPTAKEIEGGGTSLLPFSIVAYWLECLTRTWELRVQIPTQPQSSPGDLGPVTPLPVFQPNLSSRVVRAKWGGGRTMEWGIKVM